MSHPNQPPRSWREIEQIPGLVPIESLEIKAHQSSDCPSQIDNKQVEIRWKRQAGLDWQSFRAVKVARVYSETLVLLEKRDGTRLWASLRDLSLVRLSDSELRPASTSSSPDHVL
jgi:hypothetical protein